MFHRFESAVPNRHGRHPGVFSLANGLGHGGLLRPDDHAWWLSESARGDALYTDPSTVDPTCYDQEVNPGARAWFRSSATELLAITQPYLDLLDRYGVRWVELRTNSPGHIVYEDDVQVVTVPYDHTTHWPFPQGALPAKVRIDRSPRRARAGRSANPKSR